ncbi:Transcriptional regulator LytR [anaerobic digester metagenome]|nr:LCP family protein [Clostridiaceae bacterium HFYG-1003]
MNDDLFEDRITVHRKTRRGLLAAISIVFFLIIGVVVLMGFQYKNLIMLNIQGEEITPEEVAVNSQVVEKINSYNNQVANILLVGIDSSVNNTRPQRSDSMIILSVDDIHKTIKMSSLMRDTYVNIDGHGKDKLNHSYAYGGIRLLMKTINQNFDMNVTDYVQVDFGDLITIVNDLGGVEMAVTKAEARYTNIVIEQINKSNRTSVPLLELKDQTINLDGTQALAFSRIRYLDSDYARAARQRKVLMAVYSKMKQVNPTELPKFIADMSQHVETNLNEFQIFDLAMKANDPKMTVHGTRFPSERTATEVNAKSWHLLYDKAKTVEELHAFIFKDVDPATGKALNPEQNTKPGTP